MTRPGNGLPPLTSGLVPVLRRAVTPHREGRPVTRLLTARAVAATAVASLALLLLGRHLSKETTA